MKRPKSNVSLAALSLLALVHSGSGTGAEREPSEPQTQQQPAAASQHQHRRGPKRFSLSNSDGASITLWKPDLTTQPLEARHGHVTLPSTGMDNYHVVVAEKDWGNSREAVIRYEYMRGKPSQHSPAEMTANVKTAFEIVPDPVPREHYHYHSNQIWGFILRLNGSPVPNIKVTLETDHGSVVEGLTDHAGKVSLHIPDDFPNIEEGERDKRSAEFTVSAETVADDITYHSQLAADYRVNPAHWQSIGWGVGVAGLGFLVGGFIGRSGQAKRKGRGA